PPRPTDARRRGHGRRGAAFAQVARVEVTRRHRSRAPWRRPGGWKWETGGSESQVTPTSGDARRPPPRPGGGRWWQWGEVGDRPRRWGERPPRGPAGQRSGTNRPPGAS